MENHSENEEDLNSLMIKDNIFASKYIKSDVLFYNRENLIDDLNVNIENLICPICYFILDNPKSCSRRNNSHSFCQKCIDLYLKNNNSCPICKDFFEYKTNHEIKNLLNKLSFKCMFNKEGCKDIISHSKYFNHIRNCEFNNLTFECQIKKFSYKNKKFEICGYLGNKKNIEKHFLSCAYAKCRCIFCNKNIFRMNFEKHAKKECKFIIANGENEITYIGEKKNSFKEGYGIANIPNEIKCEGEFKNDSFEGFGIAIFANGGRFEGEGEKSDIKIGTYYYPIGGIYEGEFKDSEKEGYGIFYYSDGTIYEGEWKSNHPEGYGIFYCSNGDIYETEWKDRKLIRKRILGSSWDTIYDGKMRDIFTRILSSKYISLLYSYIMKNKITIMLIILLLELII